MTWVSISLRDRLKSIGAGNNSMHLILIFYFDYTIPSSNAVLNRWTRIVNLFEGYTACGNSFYSYDFMNFLHSTFRGISYVSLKHVRRKMFNIANTEARVQRHVRGPSYTEKCKYARWKNRDIRVRFSYRLNRIKVNWWMVHCFCGGGGGELFILWQ